MGLKYITGVGRESQARKVRERDGSGTRLNGTGWERESQARKVRERDGSGTRLNGTGWERE